MKRLSILSLALFLVLTACTNNKPVPSPTASPAQSPPALATPSPSAPPEESPSATPSPSVETGEVTVIQRNDLGGTSFWLNEYDSDLGAKSSVVGLKDGKRYWALFRPSLPSGVTSGQLQSAFFLLRKTGGEAGELQAAQITERWGYNVGWNSFEETVSTENVSTDITEKDGWLHINITDFVRGWLAGDLDNYGFVLREMTDNSESVYVSSQTEDEENAPRVVVTYTKESGGEPYGKYDFSAAENGNCLSYALRDTDNINFWDLYETKDEVQALYEKGGKEGLDALLELTAQGVISYVEKSKTALAVKSFRRLESYNTPIDAAKEYRIAMRVGFGDLLSEGEMEEEGVPVDCDYHLWVQTSDGSWAQKFVIAPAQPVPGTHRETDPGKYPWQMGMDWGTLNSAFYNSGVAYFAVEKSPDEFTMHKGGITPNDGGEGGEGGEGGGESLD